MYVIQFIYFCFIFHSFRCADFQDQQIIPNNVIYSDSDVLNGNNLSDNEYINLNRSTKTKVNRFWINELFFHNAVVFKFYRHGALVYESISYEPDLIKKSGCRFDEKFAFILHGWKQNCNAEWVAKLIERLTYHRGGCIVCIDYRIFSDKPYMLLYKHFRDITNIIATKMYHLINEGFDPGRGYMFGFSFGGQLASSVGRLLSPRHIFQNMDICDMAGPGFDIFSVVNHSLAAKHVQCFHSSHDKGTSIYSCHQNVRLGQCGYNQPAGTTQKYFSNHGLCVQIYINAFDYPFYAVPLRTSSCFSKNPATKLPYHFQIGYNERPNKFVKGEIFVPTSPNFPYNLSEKELLAANFEQ